MLRLKVIRLNAQLTAFQLAQAARISSGRYSYLERGMLAPSPDERKRLAQILGVSPASLFRSLSIRGANQPKERAPRAGRSA
jgi:transcriptional regulator with XRE-family HTH domain